MKFDFEELFGDIIFLHIIFALILFIFILLSGCSGMQPREIPVTDKQSEIIKHDLEKYLTKNKRVWSVSDVNKTVSALKLVENKYSINHKIILKICQTESRFDLNAINKNKNGTTDCGLVQHNRVNQKCYENAARMIGNNINDNYNPATNILFAAMYLSWTRSELIKQHDFSERRWVVSYNCGLGGSSELYTKLKAKRAKYWAAYVRS